MLRRHSTISRLDVMLQSVCCSTLLTDVPTCAGRRKLDAVQDRCGSIARDVTTLERRLANFERSAELGWSSSDEAG